MEAIDEIWQAHQRELDSRSGIGVQRAAILLLARCLMVTRDEVLRVSGTDPEARAQLGAAVTSLGTEALMVLQSRGKSPYTQEQLVAALKLNEPYYIDFTAASDPLREWAQHVKVAGQTVGLAVGEGHEDLPPVESALLEIVRLAIRLLEYWAVP